MSLSSLPPLSPMTILIVVLVLVLISLHQIRWFPLDTRRLLRAPVILLIGAVYLARDALNGTAGWSLHPMDLVLLVVEVLLALGGGLLMGRLSETKEVGGGVMMRLRPVGLVVWFGYFGVRIGTEVLAHGLHLALSSSTPLLLVMIAVVKGVQAAVMLQSSALATASLRTA